LPLATDLLKKKMGTKILSASVGVDGCEGRPLVPGDWVLAGELGLFAATLAAATAA